MSNPSPESRGMRKVKHAEKMAGYLLLGFVIYIPAYIFGKLPVEAFMGYGGFIVTISGAFVYGNSKEHQSQKAAAAQPQGAPA